MLVKDWITEKKAYGAMIKEAQIKNEEPQLPSHMNNSAIAAHAILKKFPDIETLVKGWVGGVIMQIRAHGPFVTPTVVEGALTGLLMEMLRTNDDPMWAEVKQLMESAEQHGEAGVNI